MAARAGSRRRQRAVAAALWIGLFGIYAANGREIGASDTIPSVLMPISMLRGDGVRLDRFRHIWPSHLPYYVADKGGAIVSRYPLGPPLLALPFTVPQLALLDRRHVDWERDGNGALYWARKLGKISAAALAAITGAALYLLLCAIGLAAVALPATLITALGSNLWMTGSQSLWQHGPAAMALTVALVLTVPPAPTRLRLLLAGGACAALVYCRPQDALFAMVIVLAVAIRDGIRAGFLVPPAADRARQRAHRVQPDLLRPCAGRIRRAAGDHQSRRAWEHHAVRRRPAGAMLGTLVSPSRGLFVFTPWVVLTLLALPAIWPALRSWIVLRLTILALPVFFLQVILLSTWWGGWSFGPRYWTDAMPLFGILLAFALDWARRRSRPALAALLITGSLGIVVQTIGALCYPSSFNAVPGRHRPAARAAVDVARRRARPLPARRAASLGMSGATGDPRRPSRVRSSPSDRSPPSRTARTRRCVR